MRRIIISFLLIVLCTPIAFSQLKQISYRWTKLSTEYGEIVIPNKGKIQTACITADFTKNGKDEFIIVEKTEDPSIVMYVHVENRTWVIYEIEKRKLDATESITTADIDGDGDLDLCVGGEGKEIWWWENPYPNFATDKQWKRNYIKKSGAEMHQDIVFGDFDGDKKLEVAFWNQGAYALFVGEKPDNVSRVDNWPLTQIYSYTVDGQMEQHTMGTELKVRGINYHSGAVVADINSDGIDDIVAGGMWFNYADGKYNMNTIDGGFISARIQVGKIVPGGRSEVVMVSGDGTGPMIMFEYVNGIWKQTELQKNLRRAQSLILVDFDHDGDMDIFSAEMRTREINDPKVFMLLNEGNGNYRRLEIDSGKGVHMLSLGDIDGDGDYDLIGKPYAWDTPRIDIWLNEGIK